MIIQTHNIGDIWIARILRKRPAGRYIRRGKSDPIKLRRAEDASFQGLTCNGIPVSTFSPRVWVFGVIMRKPRGKKLLSKHETLEEAMEAADRWESGD